ncbi:MAG: hypothetical protein KDA45_16340, partial [Planctomycetales bacterium]|nr:hypothetical protein [Planctomycetales bacterium]
MKFPIFFAFAVLLAGWVAAHVPADEGATAIKPLLRAVDLAIGQSAEVTLCDGSQATIKLLAVEETRDSVMQAVRRAEVTVEVNGEQGQLVSATYHLPKTIGGVQVDC